MRAETPETCETFARNAIRLKKYDPAAQTLQHAIKLHVQSHGAVTQAEKECIEAIYAYEAVLRKRHGKRQVR